MKNLALAYPGAVARGRAQADCRRHVGESWPHLRRDRSHLGRSSPKKRIRFERREQLDEIIRGGPVRRLRPASRQLGARRLRRASSWASPFSGVYQRLSNPLVDEETPQAAAAFLYDGGLLPKTPVTRARADESREAAAVILHSSPTFATTTAPSFHSSDAPALARPFFPLFSPARPVCRFTPAPPSASPTCAS